MATFWTMIGESLAVDFSELADGPSVIRIIARLLAAALLGGVLGWQRECHGKAAGMRTHMLVALGTASFVLIPAQMEWSSADLSRVVQGVVTGIGFLGAGTILKRNDERSIQGLTTAADIWLTAAVGVAAGLGRLASAGLVALLAYVILSLAFHFGPAPPPDNGPESKSARS
jgi:putative Mg2+ transporter-C (MgtC) family protein